MPSHRSRSRVQRSATGSEAVSSLPRNARLSQKDGDQGTRVPSLAVVDAGHGLPAQLTTFIGRERELADLRRLLRDARLVTLVGVGGVGKTRLALQLVATRRRPFADGAWLVDLAAIGDGALVARTIVARLGLREQIGRPLVVTLVEYLKAR